jgi:hypothetical protein
MMCSENALASTWGEAALYSNLTVKGQGSKNIFFFHFSFIIHMCIQGLVHFSPLPPPPVKIS